MMLRLLAGAPCGGMGLGRHEAILGVASGLRGSRVPRAPQTKLRRIVSALLAITMGLGIGLVVGFQIKPNSQAVAAGPCDLPVQNAIACENTLPGNPQSEWDVDGAGDPTIQGFGTDISVNKGDTVDFKIITDATAYTPRHLPPRLLRRRRRAQGGDDHADRQRCRRSNPIVSVTRRPAWSTAGTGHVSASWPVPAERGLRHLHRAPAPHRHRRRQPHRLHRSRRRQPLEADLPDFRPRVAGLQRLRRKQPVRRAHPRAAPTR